MRLVSGPYLIFTLILSTGCSMQQPKNAAEFRQMLPGSMFGKYETFEVNTPYSKVVSAFKKRARKCLSVEVVQTTTNQYGQTMGTTNLTYTPTLIVGKQKTELHVQQHIKGSVIVVGEQPKDGFYMFVADATQAGKNKTKLELYRGTYGSDTMAKAIRNWATGKNMGCPDLTKG